MKFKVIAPWGHWKIRETREEAEVWVRIWSDLISNVPELDPNNKGVIVEEIP